jgi:hypothetical protein
MTEPYSSAADNSQFVANLADFCAGAQRAAGLADFPSFLGDSVDLVFLSDPAVDPTWEGAALEQAARVQAALSAEGRVLQWRQKPTAGRDTFYLGVYGGMFVHSEVGEILSDQGITFTLEGVERALTPTVVTTPAREPRVDATLEVSPTAAPAQDWIHLSGGARVDARHSALFYQGQQGSHHVLVVMSFDELGLDAAIERLLDGDYVDCLVDYGEEDGHLVSMALCPTDHTPIAAETSLPEPTPVWETPAASAPGQSVLVVSDDDGEGTYDWWTSAYDFYDFATAAGFETALVSTSLDGPVSLDQVLDYDAVIWCTGDYREQGMTPQEEDLLTLLAYLNEGGGVILEGAFLGDPLESEVGLLLDVQVSDMDHPLAAGMDPTQPIPLQRFTAEEDYEAQVLSDLATGVVVLARGPESEASGSPALIAQEGDAVSGRMVWIGFPIFLLPYDLEVNLAANTLSWVLDN